MRASERLHRGTIWNKDNNKKQYYGQIDNICCCLYKIIASSGKLYIVFYNFAAQNYIRTTMETIIGLTVPFLGTALGAAVVLMLRGGITEKTNSAMLGFASGVMVAASFWSLLQPALEQVGDGIGNTWPVLAGFAAGVCT